MTVAFYAPLKPPNHPVPSGDRSMARALIKALQYAGYTVEPVSDLRLYDKFGQKQLQAQLKQEAQGEADRLLTDTASKSWTAWVTYHNYYKAPDLIGPAVTAALNIPYLQVESTRARKRLVGPWAEFATAAESASDAADVIFYFTHRDAETLRRDAPEGQRLIHLAPFLARDDLPPESKRKGAMLSVGMMRKGDKLASYRLIADTLALLPPNLDWHLNIAGDGEARTDVEWMMTPFGKRVEFLGQQDAEALSNQYANASLFFWPGVNEAFGLAYLEAQATGLPVVAQDRPGVRDVVFGQHPRPQEGAEAMAHQIVSLLSDDKTRNRTGQDARLKVQSNHLLGNAATALKSAMEVLT